MLDSHPVVQEFIKIVQIDSLSLREEAMFDYLDKRLSGLPVEKEFIPYTVPETGQKSGNLIVRLPGNTKEKKSVFFDAHLDTVEPGLGIKPHIKDGRVWSDGNTILGSDDKAGVAAMIIALENLCKSEKARGDAVFLFTSAEEIGLTGIHFLDFTKIRADMGYILDSHGSVGGVILAAPYHYKYDILVTGRASHAGIAPEQGQSAVIAAARLVMKLPQGKISNDTVANVGLIEGGRATNIVPGECRIQGEYRTHNIKEGQKVRAAIEKAVKECRRYAQDIKLDFTHIYDGFHFDENAPVISLAVKAIKAMGLNPRLERTGGGSNTNIYNQHKIESVTLAVGMTDVHSNSESIALQDLVHLEQLIEKIVELS